MKKQLFIHIGFGKTGTTAVQEIFHASRDLLRQNGVLYPSTGVFPTGHHMLAPLNEAAIQGDTVEEYKKLLDEIATDASEKILVSSENYCFMKETFIAAMPKLFSKVDTRIVFYVRPQVELIESTFLQWKKTGQKCPDELQLFFRQNASGFNFSMRLAPWIKAFGKKNIIVRRYEGDTRIDILRAIGVAPGFLQPVIKAGGKRSNPSLSPEFVKLATLINGAELDKVKRWEMMQELLRLTGFLDVNRVKKLMPPPLKARIEEYYAPSNDEIRELFGVDVLGKNNND